MKVITYQIELLEPVLVTALDGDPNSSVSFDYLPGSVLRGALVGHYIQKKRQSNPDYALDSHKDEIRGLFLDGRARYLNGYPLDKRRSQRGLPLPLSFHLEKGNKTPFYDFAAGAEYGADEPPKSIPGGFGLLSPGQLRQTKVERQIAVHTARNRRFGRARGGRSEDELTGAVYRYDSLAAGQTFVAHILCRDGDVTELQPLIQGIFHLGGARSAGYGRARLTWVGVQEAANWSETGPPPAAPADRVIITLLSDLMIRDATGQFSVNPRDVAATLGLKLLDGGVYARYRPIGGFNRKWGLPTPQTTAFQMGSVFVCQKPAAEQWEALRQFERDGLGERLAEGFGRVVVNWHTTTGDYALEKENGSQKPDIISLPESSADYAIAQQMADRLLRRQIEQYVMAEANNLSKRQKGLRKSQIYGLRQEVQKSLQNILTRRDADLKRERQQLKKYLASLKDRAKTRRQFARARIEDQPMLKWVQARVEATDVEEIKQKIDRIKTIGGVESAWDDRLVFETNLRLINAILSRMAKKAQEVT